MKIEQIHTDRQRFMTFLMLADEQESMIDRYIDRGEMYALFIQENVPVCTAIVTDEGGGVCELKSLTVLPQYQRKGYGRQMLDFLCSRYVGKFAVMTAGTGDSRKTMEFYKNCGFVHSHTVSNFFVDNYDHPIVEEGKILKDMIYFRKRL